MNKRLIAVLVGVLAIGALVAGCGGSDDSSTDTSGDSATALTKAEFIKQGDAICAKGNEEIESGAEEFAKENDVDTGSPTDAQQEEVVSEVVVPSLQGEAEELGALGAPNGEEKQVEAILTSLEGAIAEIEDDPSTLIEGEPFDEANELAKKFGLKVCGEE